MLAPERRTRADIISAVVIAVLVVVAAIVVWARGDARGTESVTATHPATAPTPADKLPTGLRELWHAPDSADARALVAGGVAVTGEEGSVVGHDLTTGEQVWRYRRDMPLCGVESQFGMVIAVYRDQRGCSQATLLAGEDGSRRTARSSYMDKSVRLSVDGTYVLAAGRDRLEMWRSDLVRTVEYGYVDAQVNAKTQPRTGCTLLSAGSSAARLAVVERCPNDPSNRLSVLNPAPKDNTVPEEYGSHVLTGPGADAPGVRVLAVSDSRVALYLPPAPHPVADAPAGPRIGIYDASGNQLLLRDLPAPIADTATTRIGSAFFVFTGDSVIALSASTFDQLWQAPGAVGTPALMAGRLLLPVAGGIAVLDPSTGAEQSRIPVDRPDYGGAPLSLSVLGAVILEKRGATLFALG
ncbi:hypothetical protein D5S18_01320 [Nocardia panacis]|uniref:PQQ-binding-like beta-propeller repeat protein n=1 Tax=Nocardia panacis TaxID=2340916 RepID=A0A3A4KJ89_9NOCA|nr:PQQ-binding-like beta-propeller repeat protein [Nocardia panacis]RJO79930.1 hypothetical protein D5S18_01320 [Nocardia panacis]